MSDAEEFNKTPTCPICGELVLLSRIHVKEGGETFHFGCCSGRKSSAALDRRIGEAEAVIAGLLASNVVFEASMAAVEKTVEVVENENGRVIEKNRKLIQRVTQLEGNLAKLQEQLINTNHSLSEDRVAQLEKAELLRRGTHRVPEFDVKQHNVRACLCAVLDAVDYTEGNCGPGELISAVLPEVLIENARKALKKETP